MPDIGLAAGRQATVSEHQLELHLTTSVDVDAGAGGLQLSERVKRERRRPQPRYGLDGARCETGVRVQGDDKVGQLAASDTLYSMPPWRKGRQGSLVQDEGEAPDGGEEGHGKHMTTA